MEASSKTETTPTNGNTTWYIGYTCPYQEKCRDFNTEHCSSCKHSKRSYYEPVTPLPDYPIYPIYPVYPVYPYYEPYHPNYPYDPTIITYNS